MNKQHIEIKEKRNSFLLKGSGYLILTVVSLFVTLLPYVSSELSASKLCFFLFGGAAFVAFTINFVLHIYNELNPRSVIFISEKGFTDIINIGEYEIEWTNVASVRLLKKPTAQYLGIYLDNNDLVIESIKTKKAENIKSNLEDNLPAIIIDANRVRTSLSELKEIFTERVKEARKVEEDHYQRPKNNPFTTEDVLRAFGKVSANEETTDISADSEYVSPENNDNETDVSIDEDFNNIINDLSTFVPDEFESNAPKADNELTDNCIEHATDLSATLIFTPEDQCSKTEDTESELTFDIGNVDFSLELDSPETDEENHLNEVDDILSRAKSTKISEIEKMLSESEMPFSFSRIESSCDTNDDNSSDLSKETDFEINDFDSSHTSTKYDFDQSLDELIRSALEPTNTIKSETPSNNDSSSDAMHKKQDPQKEEAYPDLVNFNDDSFMYENIIIPKID